MDELWEEKLATWVAMAENHDEPAVLPANDLTDLGIEWGEAVDLADHANGEWKRLGSSRRFVVDPATRTIQIAIIGTGCEIFSERQKELWRGMYDGAEADINPHIRKQIEKGKAVEILEDGTVVRIRRNRSNPRSLPLETRFRENGVINNIRKARDSALLEKVLKSGSNFRVLDPEEQKKLVYEAMRISLSVVLDSASVYKRLKDGRTSTVLCHVRQGFTRDIHNLSPTVWIGEKLLSRLSPEQIARVLMEESQHLVRPFKYLPDGSTAGLHKGEKPEVSDPKTYVWHDEAFMDQLMEIILWAETSRVRPEEDANSMKFARTES